MKDHIEKYFGSDYSSFFGKYLEFTKTTGDQWKAFCPFHAESEGSLSIKISNGLWKCLGCGKGGNVYQFYARLKRLNSRKDFPVILEKICDDFGILVGGNGNGKAVPVVEKSAKTKSVNRGEIVARYTYLDADGTPLYQKVRYWNAETQEKTFAFFIPNARIKDGWLAGRLEDVKRRVLYNLPDVIASHTIYICEGEKDADNLRALGFHTTCNDGGAVSGELKENSKKWPDEFNDILSGKTIRIVPDHDAAGISHAKNLARMLHGKAKSIKIVKLPNPERKPKYDASDFILDVGDKRTAAQLIMAHVREAPECDGTEPDLSDLLVESASAAEVEAKPATTPKAAKTTSLEFPAQVLKGAAGNYAKAMSEIFESPIQFFYFSHLTVLGSVLSPNLEGFSALEDQPRLFTVLLGKSGETRKSFAISTTVRMFRDAIGTKEAPKSQDFPGLNYLEGIGSAEGLRRLFASSPSYDFKEDEEPAVERLGLKDPPRRKKERSPLMNDWEMEQRSKEGMTPLLLVFDEFKEFVNKCSIKGSILLETVNKLFEQNSYHSSVKKETFRIDNACLALLSASTLDTWERMFTAVFRDIGFINRVWIVPGQGQCFSSLPDREKAEVILSKARVELVQILSRVGTSGKCIYAANDEARERYDQWYNEREISFHSVRIDAYARRLMPLLAANSGKAEIDLEVMEDAIALCDWQLRVRRVYDPIDSESRLAEMEEKIRRVLLSGPKKSTQIKQMVNYKRFGIWFFDRAAENLLAAGEIAKDDESNFYLAETD